MWCYVIVLMCNLHISKLYNFVVPEIEVLHDPFGNIVFSCVQLKGVLNNNVFICVSLAIKNGLLQFIIFFVNMEEKRNRVSFWLFFSNFIAFLSSL